jgi:hypothetical protein
MKLTLREISEHVIKLKNMYFDLFYKLVINLIEINYPPIILSCSVLFTHNRKAHFATVIQSSALY